MIKKEKLKETIGFEVHIELNTKSKMFCGCPANHFGLKPNTHTCPVCLGLPGALPVPNIMAIEWTHMIGLALNCSVNRKSKFDRKHYFYPDLPKSYQISQYDKPFCSNGHLETSLGKVRITRVHLEEDTGKLLHKKVNGKGVTLIDFNRSGVPLVEIVTEPDIVSAEHAKEVAQKIQQLVRHLKVSNCDMEKGSMRLEANISWGVDLNYKVEIKNLNSFRFVKKAIEHELARQKKLLDKNVLPAQETRGWDEVKNKTKGQRRKEVEEDYRYFPEPDIPPMVFDKKYINSLKDKLPELPEEIRMKLINKYKISSDYAKILVSSPKSAKFIEKAIRMAIKEGLNVSEFVNLIVNKKINLTSVDIKSLIKEIKKKKSDKIDDKEKIGKWVNQAISNVPQAVQDYKKGKLNAIGSIIGQVMKLSSGKADPKITRLIIRRKLKGK